MSGYILGTDAALDLDDIWTYIANDDGDAADRWIGKLFDAFEALALMPDTGHNLGRNRRRHEGSRDIPSFLRRA